MKIPDWGRFGIIRVGGGRYNDGVFVPLFTIFVVVLCTYYAVVMIRRQIRERREWRQQRDRAAHLLRWRQHQSEPRREPC